MNSKRIIRSAIAAGLLTSLVVSGPVSGETVFTQDNMEEEGAHPSVRNALSKKRLFEIEAERYKEENPGEEEHVEELRELVNAAFDAAGEPE